MSAATDRRIVGHQVDSLIKKTQKLNNYLRRHLVSTVCFFFFFCNVACMLAKCVISILFVKIREGFFLPLKLVASFAFKGRCGYPHHFKTITTQKLWPHQTLQKHSLI